MHIWVLGALCVAEAGGVFRPLDPARLQLGALPPHWALVAALDSASALAFLEPLLIRSPTLDERCWPHAAGEGPNEEALAELFR